MANNFTTLNTDFIGNLVLDQFVQTLLPLRAFTLSATNQVAFRGDTVKVLTVQTGSAASDYTNTYNMDNSHATGVDVTLNKHKYVSLELLDSQWRDSALLEVEKFARAKGFALAQSVLQDTMTFFSASFAPETQTVAKSTSFSASAVVNLSNTCDSLNWPQYERSLVLTPTQHSYLRKDTALQAAYAFGSPDVIRKGEVPSLDTFSSIYKSAVVPAGSVGFACVPNALIWASRVVSAQEPNAYHEVRVFTDSETGLSITQKKWSNPDAGSSRTIWECEYGYAVGNAKGAFLLV